MDDRSLGFDVIECTRKWGIRFLHDVSYYQSYTSWDSSHTMYQYISTFSLRLNEIITVFKEYWNAAWFVINNRYIQIFNMFGYFLWQIFAFNCRNDSSNIMFFQCERITGRLNVTNENSTTTILFWYYQADIFSKCSVWVHHFLSL